MAIKALSRES